MSVIPAQIDINLLNSKQKDCLQGDRDKHFAYIQA